MIRKTYVKAICMGVVAGMRSISAPAFVSHYLARKESKELADSPFGLMGSQRVAQALKIAAAGEMVADKLPVIPDRIAPGPLAARILSGALCGASLCTAEGKRARVGAMCGALSAVASAYAFYHLRRKIGETEALPDAALGLSEDALVICTGLSVLSD
ncbi:MAG TPA: DUF4126 family protein [Pyrinomonadaceae bacterium]|jgi:uncharacterized membrane protein